MFVLFKNNRYYEKIKRKFKKMGFIPLENAGFYSNNTTNLRLNAALVF